MAIGWGVVGAAGIADRRTIPEGILPAKNARLVAVADVVEGRARQVADKHGGVRAYATSDELYRDAEVEAVYLGIPNHLHAIETIKAAEAGKHVFCEKPMACTLEECERMARKCADHNVKFGVGYMMRYHPLHVKLKRMIDEDRLGTLVMGRAQLTCWYPSIEGAWRQDPKLGAGGSLMDMGSHCLDVLEMLFGPIVSVSCVAESLVQDYLVEDTAVVMAKFECGAIGIVDSHFNVPDAASLNVLEVYGSKGSVMATGTIGQSSHGTMTARLVEDAGGYDAQQTRSEVAEEQVLPDVEQNIYQAEIEAFSTAIENNTPPPYGPEEGIRNMRLMMAAYQSARTGKFENVS